MKEKIRESYLLIIAATLAILIIPKFMVITDLDLDDEANLYLQRGLDIVRHHEYRHLTDINWGPLYILWYSLLFKLKATPLETYLGTAWILTFFCAIFSFLLTRRLGVGKLGALGLMLMLLLTPHFYLINRRPNLMAMTLALGFHCWARKNKQETWRKEILLCGSLLSSYCRPEYILSFLLLFCFWLKESFTAYKMRTPGKGRMLGQFILVLLLLLPRLFFQNSTDKNSLIVFLERNEERIARHEGEKFIRDRVALPPFNHLYSESTFKLFGRPHNAFQAILSNPQEFALHFFENFKDTLTRTFYFFKKNVLFFHLQDLPRSLLFYVLLVPFLVLSRGKRKQKIIFKHSHFSWPSSKILEIFCYPCFPILVSCLVFSIRDHYLICLYPFLLMMGAWVCSSFFSHRSLRPKDIVVIGIGIGWVALIGMWNFDIPLASYKTPRRDLVRALSSQLCPSNLSIFSGDGALGLFLEGRSHVQYYDMKTLEIPDLIHNLPMTTLQVQGLLQEKGINTLILWKKSPEKKFAFYQQLLEELNKNPKTFGLQKWQDPSFSTPDFQVFLSPQLLCPS